MLRVVLLVRTPLVTNRLVLIHIVGRELTALQRMMPPATGGCCCLFVLLSVRVLNVRAGTAAADCARAGGTRCCSRYLSTCSNSVSDFRIWRGPRLRSDLVDLIRRDSARTLSSDDVRVSSGRGFLLGLDRSQQNVTLRRIQVRSLVARLSSFAVPSFFTLVCRVYSPRSATTVHQLCREGNKRNGGRTCPVWFPDHFARIRTRNGLGPAGQLSERADCWAWPSSSWSWSSSWSAGRTDALWTGPDVQARTRNASSASGAT
jgi:hypothetical protein